MKSATITMDELRAELDSLSLQKNHPKGFSAIEFEDALGVSHSIAQQRLSKLVRLGYVKYLGNRPITRIDGRQNIRPVYAIVKK